MIPNLSEEQLKAFPSRAEARFYEACRDRLPDDVDAMEGDREACLAAGMNDYLAKPIKEQLLLAVIERNLRAREGG